MKQQIITPYDTGERLEPKAWHVQPRNLPSEEEAERYGRVDFDDDEGRTVLTAHVERAPTGYAVHIENATEPVTVTIAAAE